MTMTPKSLEDIKSDISILTLDIELLSDEEKKAAFEQLLSTINFLKNGNFNEKENSFKNSYSDPAVEPLIRKSLEDAPYSSFETSEDINEDKVEKVERKATLLVDSETNSKFQCIGCEQNFISENILNQHMANPENCQKALAWRKKDKLRELLPQSYECSQCMKKFVNPVALKHHYNEHTDRYKCNKDCQERFATKTHLRKHSCEKTRKFRERRKLAFTSYRSMRYGKYGIVEDNKENSKNNDFNSPSANALKTEDLTESTNELVSPVENKSHSHREVPLKTDYTSPSVDDLTPVDFIKSENVDSESHEGTLETEMAKGVIVESPIIGRLRVDEIIEKYVPKNEEMKEETEKIYLKGSLVPLSEDIRIKSPESSKTKENSAIKDLDGYVCPEESCYNKTFTSKDSLTSHKNIHLDKYKCNLKCQLGFQSSWHLKRHQCETALKRRQSESLAEDLKWKCPECPSMFSDRTSLYSHRIKHTNRFECKKCGRRFSRKGEMDRHCANPINCQRRLKPGKPIQSLESDHIFEDLKNQNVELPTEPENLQNQNLGLPSEAEDFKNQNSQLPTESEVTLDEDDLFSCDNCEKFFISMKNLQSHALHCK